MIDESVLERLLRDEAATYEPPAGGPAAVLEAAAVDEGHQPRRAWWLTGAAAAVLVVTGVVIASSGGVGRNDFDAQMGGGTGTYAVMSENGDGGDGGAAPGGGSGEKSASNDQAPDAVDGAHVVRTGETLLEVPKPRVRDALREVARVAATHGGYVSGSSADASGDRPTGEVTIRVPVASFERAVEDVSRLGVVRQAGTRGEDVTEQVNDVTARLRSATATRTQLRTLLGRATSVADVLAVQERLDEVQTEIEKLQATQQSLKDRTSFGTLRVYVSPPFSAEERGGFSKAWHDAVNGFVGGFEALVAASGTIAFVLLVGTVLFFVARRAYRVWVRGVV